MKWKQVYEQSLFVEKIYHYYVNTKNSSKVDYSYNRNWWTAGCGDLIIGIWGSGKGAAFGIDFPQNICGYDLLHHPFTLQELYVTALFYTMYML